MKPTIAFIGAGAVGTSLAILFKQAGYTVTGISSHTETSARRASILAGIPILTNQAACNSADVLFITTPDREIAQVVAELAAQRFFRAGQIVVHTSGAHSSELLSPARQFNSRLLSFHPLQTFPHPSIKLVNLSGTIFTLEGDETIIELASHMARDLGGEPVIIQSEQKVLYHAGACTASNFLISVLHLAISLLQAAGFPAAMAQQALLPLIKGTVSSLEKMSPAQALTGPIARGDTTTLHTHLSVLRDQCPELLSIYHHLAAYTLKVAREQNTLDAKQLDALHQLCSLQDKQIE